MLLWTEVELADAHVGLSVESLAALSSVDVLQIEPSDANAQRVSLFSSSI